MANMPRAEMRIETSMKVRTSDMALRCDFIPSRKVSSMYSQWIPIGMPLTSFVISLQVFFMAARALSWSPRVLMSMV